MAEKLPESEIEKRLSGLDGWSLVDGKLEREFTFPDFARAFGFMTSAAIEAEKMNHHPEWSNVYNRVKVQLVTHSVRGISELDFALAKKLDALL